MYLNAYNLPIGYTVKVSPLILTFYRRFLTGGKSRCETFSGFLSPKQFYWFASNRAQQ